MNDSDAVLTAFLLLALVAAFAFGWLTARLRARRTSRCADAHKLLRALERYSAWVRAQRLATVFHGEGPQAAAALEKASTLHRTAFPQLAAEMAVLLATHHRLLRFLGSQQALWLRDPAHWLQSGHDQHFMALWHEHRQAVQALVTRLERLTGVRLQASAPSQPPRREPTYA
jgi:hypothetical protein